MNCVDAEACSRWQRQIGTCWYRNDIWNFNSDSPSVRTKISCSAWEVSGFLFFLSFADLQKWEERCEKPYENFTRTTHPIFEENEYSFFCRAVLCLRSKCLVNSCTNERTNLPVEDLHDSKQTVIFSNHYEVQQGFQQVVQSNIQL